MPKPRPLEEMNLNLVSDANEFQRESGASYDIWIFSVGDSSLIPMVDLHGQANPVCQRSIMGRHPGRQTISHAVSTRLLPIPLRLAGGITPISLRFQVSFLNLRPSLKPDI